MIFGSDLFTNIHVAISLIAIVSGFIFLFQLLGGARSASVTAVFLLFTILTSVTGFFFKQTGAQPTPGQIVGAVSLLLLAVALLALYGRNLRPMAWHISHHGAYGAMAQCVGAHHPTVPESAGLADTRARRAAYRAGVRRNPGRGAAVLHRDRPDVLAAFSARMR